MNYKPLLSIHLLTYNHENYIEKCLDSIINQVTDYNFEIIIADDASSDNTPKILIDYKNKYPDLIDLEIHKTNKGLVVNYFETVKRCKGKYIFDIAGDDLFTKKNSINFICSELEKYKGIDFIEFEFDEFYEKTGRINTNCNSYLRKVNQEEYLYKVFKGEIWPTAWCVKTDCINELVSLNELTENSINVEDYPVAIELLANNKKFIHSSKSVMIYRKLSGSISNSQTLRSRLSFNKRIFSNAKYYHSKYKFPKYWLDKVENNYYKAMLHTSGIYGDKINGEKYFGLIKDNSTINFMYFLHYLSSQISIIRYLLSFFRKVN